jgi:hypothetical protein
VAVSFSKCSTLIGLGGLGKALDPSNQLRAAISFNVPLG